MAIGGRLRPATENLREWGGTALTGRDISTDLANLDLALTVLRDTLKAGQEYTTPTHTAPSIGTTSTIALASNAGRLYALLINDSDETIYLKLGATAVANEGIRLNANGGNYEMSKKLGNLYTGVINAICASGGKKLLILEGV